MAPQQEISMKPEERKFSERDYAAPFGRYQSGNEIGAPNEVLVGREAQRAYFIELLLRMGQRGAYLVTGQRGVGKSSFVHHCLAEYKEEVYERFLRSGVGRAVFWDHAGVLLLAFFIIFVLLMISEFMEIVAFSTGWGKGDDPNILFGLVIIPLAVICLYPLLYARGVLEKVIDTGARRVDGEKPVVRSGIMALWQRRPRLNSGLLATGSVAILAFLAFRAGPFGSPALSMSRLTLALCWMYMWIQATSFNVKEDGKPFRVYSTISAWLGAPFALLCLFLGPEVNVLLPGSWLPGADQEFYGNLLWGAMLLGAGILLRGLHLKHAIGSWEAETSEDEGSTATERPAHQWYMFTGFLVVSGVAGLFLWMINENKAVPLSLYGASLCIVCAFFTLWLAIHRWRKPIPNAFVGWSFRPRPRAVLAAKAFLSIVVTLQLIHPVFDKWTPAQSRESLEKEMKSSPSGRRPATALYSISSLWEEEEATRQELGRAKNSLKILSAQKLSENASKRNADIQKVTQSRIAKLEEILLEKERRGLQRRNSVVFYGRAEEISWVVALFLALSVIYFMEYEWVVRPFAKEREDGALDKVSRASWEDQRPEGSFSREDYRELARMTLPWMLYDRWLPILTVSVNLGFEKLDHRRVVHAMLAGLRDQYYRAFCAWNSSMANLARLFGFLLLMMFVTLAGDRWFAMPSLEREKVNMTFAESDYEKICDLFRGRQIGAGMANWICKMKWGDSIVHVLYYNILDSGRDLPDSDRQRHLLFYVFPYSQEAWPADGVRAAELEPFLKRGIQLRVYHLALFLLFFLLARWVLGRVPLLPYRDLLQRIDHTTDSLEARTSVTSTLGRWTPAQWLQGLFLDERVRQTEQDPVDPRTVEFAFLQILREIQGASIQLPGGRSQLVSLPTPEISFVLDELDKIGTRVDPDESASSGGAQQAEIINAERRRSMELHRLLADMKNLLSSAPARFIFVGGRNLHDEWLADQTARQPLLTNIFTAEVYLPTLLTDANEERGVEQKLSFQVERYVINQKNRADRLYRRSWQKRWLPMVALPLEARERESFLQSEPDKRSAKGSNGIFQIYYARPEGSGCEDSVDGSFLKKKDLEEDFIQFLTYRSLGNSKKLKELLATFIRPAGRVVRDPTERWKEFRDCDHVLFFGDTERFRIQLLARVYRHLTVHFEQALVRRDDKLTASVLYLTDFLFKFHRRAFSWSSLERADELVHIHRAPDLREILEAIVVQWSERFLHSIRNGMYDFRFRSDMAREIEYVSRQSAEEMAAFNFTLDESQTLKAAYETNIARLGNSKEAQDLVAGLGELYEFDQEYETARLYYRRAISMLDMELEEMIGSSPLDPETSRIEIIGGVLKGQEKARSYMTWGVARLRLMLQIGMTFEHSRNMERAEMEYQNARTLATSLLLAMLDEEGRAAISPGLSRDERRSDDRLHALKHLNILFQPLFAEVWVAEKLAGGVDTSTSLAEKELWQLRRSLPFVREPNLILSESPTDVQGSNFSLIATELHNKTGDLYFIKGRQLPVIQGPGDIDTRYTTTKGSRGLEGYLLRAHYHYAVGLHEVRRFVTHRRCSSKFKLSLGRAGSTIIEGGWPDFVFRAAGGAFNDLAECLLGRLSLLSLLREWGGAVADSGSPDVKTDVDTLVKTCTKWMEGAESEEADQSSLKHSGLSQLALDKLETWVGVWQQDRPATSAELIAFSETPGTGGASTLAISLGFSFVGARYLEQGGYLEDSGREMLKVCETVSHLLWWGLATRQLAEEGKCGEAMQKASPGCWAYLFDAGLYALKEADRLFRSSRREDDETTTSLVGRKIPVAALTQVCALGLAACRWNLADKVQAGLVELLERWKETSEKWKELSEEGKELSEEKEFALRLQSLLKMSLECHSYPMINRLHALRLLIDDAVLSDAAVLSEGEEEEKEKEVEKEKVKEVEKVKFFDWTSELLDLEGNLHAPLHFTPLHSGATCALVALWAQAKKKSDRPRYWKIFNAAERALVASQEMYSMRRAFYENISDLYYLYDDFNDRQLHFNHAIQMAGAELAALLRYRLSLCERHAEDHPVVPAPSGGQEGGSVEPAKSAGVSESGGVGLAPPRKSPGSARAVHPQGTTRRDRPRKKGSGRRDRKR
jgi:hypothetical protein